MMYKVRQGDYLSKIAAEHGVADWRIIYNHANNASFRQLRPNPDLIAPGDELFIPDRGTKSLPAQTGSPARFKAHRSQTTLRVKLLDHQGNPLAGKPCKLEYYGSSRSVTTDSGGMLQATVPPDLSEARLTVDGVSRTLAIGHLNPMAAAGAAGVAGVQARLRNLGYEPGNIDGVLTDETREAIRKFEKDNSLQLTGTISPALESKLRQQYGC